eukprot:271014_1
MHGKEKRLNNTKKTNFALQTMVGDCVEHFMITNNMECQCVQQRSLRAGPYSLPSGGDNWHDPDRRSTPKSYTATSKADVKHEMINNNPLMVNEYTVCEW